MRELEHAVIATVAMSTGDFIRGADLPLGPKTVVEELDVAELFNLPLTEAKAQLVESFERRAIQRALESNEGNVSAAARQLGIHRQSLQQKMSQLDIRHSEEEGHG